MKVQVCKSVEIDTEVQVTVEDITAALQYAIDEACDRASNPGATSKQRNFVLCEALVACFQVLKSVTDEMIEGMAPKQRDALYNALSEQIARLKP